MNYVFCAAVAVAFIMPATSSAKDQNTIVVSSRHDPAKQWSSAVSRDLESNLEYPMYAGMRASPTGIVSIRFNCAGDGTARNVTVSRPSGDYILDRAAANAVAHLKSLHPLTGTLAANQLVQANIFFAEDEGQLARQIAQLGRERAQALAAGSNDRPTIALNFDVRAPS